MKRIIYLIVAAVLTVSFFSYADYLSAEYVKGLSKSQQEVNAEIAAKQRENEQLHNLDLSCTKGDGNACTQAQ